MIKGVHAGWLWLTTLLAACGPSDAETVATPPEHPIDADTPAPPFLRNANPVEAAGSVVPCLWACGDEPPTEPPAPGHFVEATFSGVSGSLDYVIYVPTGYASDSPRAVIMLLHGCAQTADDLITATQIVALSDREGVLVVVPSQNSSANPQGCWNWFLPAHQQRDTGEPGLLMGILGEIQTHYAVDPTRLYVVGFSAGGAMASILGSCYADEIAALGVHSGLPYEAASNSIEAFTAMASGSVEAPEVAGHDAYACSGQPDRPLPIMVIHGTADGTVNVLNSRQIITELMTLADLADDGQDNESVPDVPSATETSLLPQGSFETETYGPLSAPLAHRVTVAGLGHAWSGGDASAPYADPDDPDATEALWRFLAVQARSDTSAETR